jgi:alpha-tubulin suppressor-like RCC1 family protein
LNAVGEIFTWGKGERGQLGHEHGAVDAKESHTAQPVQRVLVDVAAADTGKPVYDLLGPVAQIAAGMIHSAALELDTNRVFLWGKNMLPLPPNGKGTRGRKVASDARLPFVLRGLPQRQVLQIACGSHHTSFLLEDGSVWAVGLATDTVKPIHTPFCLIEPGIVDLPVRQFVAHMDRTTVITATGEVLQAHLWEEPENRAYAVFTPAWVDELLANSCEPGTRIRQVHRSWLHTLVVTERDVD